MNHMQKWFPLAIGVAGVMLFSAWAVAQTPQGFAQGGMNRIDRRQRIQQARIRQGFRNDQLTNREVRQLQREQRRIRRLEARTAADGQRTWQERRRLNRALNVASRHVFRQKHDRQRRY